MILLWERSPHMCQYCKPNLLLLRRNKIKRPQVPSALGLFKPKIITCCNFSVKGMIYMLILTRASALIDCFFSILLRSREIAKVRWKGAAGTQRSDVKACSPSALGSGSRGEMQKERDGHCIVDPGSSGFSPRTNTMGQSPQQQQDGQTTEIKP